MSFRLESSSTSTSTSTPTPTSTLRSAHETEGPSAFARVLQSMGKELDRGERVTREALAAARAGREPSPVELIALQSQIYRYTEVVDLAAKLVDRATSGVKTVVQGQ